MNEQHLISIAVWGLDGPIQAGDGLTVFVGARCNHACSLARQEIVVLGADDAPVAHEALGDTRWRGTASLYWCSVELAVANEAKRSCWKARVLPADLAAVHVGSDFGFGISSVLQPQYRLTVQYTERESSEPVAAAHVRAGHYRGVTDERGLATLPVAAGDYTVSAWKPRYAAADQLVSVESDTEVRLTTGIVDDKDPQYIR